MITKQGSKPIPVKVDPVMDIKQVQEILSSTLYEGRQLKTEVTTSNKENLDST